MCLTACPPKKEEEDFTVSRSLAPALIQAVLEEVGVDVQVAIDDVNGDGREDYYVRYTGIPPMSVERFGEILLGVTIALREISRRGNYYVDNAYLHIEDALFEARMAEIFYCQDTHVDTEEEMLCLVKAWHVVGGSPEFGKRFEDSGRPAL